MNVRADEVITAAVLTADYVRGRYPDARCFLVNSGQIAEAMSRSSDSSRVQSSLAGASVGSGEVWPFWFSF